MVTVHMGALYTGQKGKLLLFSDRWVMDESINLSASFGAAELSN